MKKSLLFFKQGINLLISVLLILSFTFQNFRSVSAESGGWIITSSMNFSRQSHTSTILRDGKVLVSGGYYGSSGLSSAELYNPTTGTWENTGFMNDPRFSHVAVLLSDGKVLVAGGDGGGYGITSAELFDPSTGEWTVTGSMNVGRYFFAANLLPNGKVLVAAGGDNTAELYDPDSGTWSFTGNLNHTRTNIEGTLLTSGKVLIAGGEYYPFGDLISAELYDPETGLWTYTSNMNNSHGHSNPPVLLSDGKVLVTGSATNPGCELYDPETDSWTNTGAMNQARRGHFAILLPDGKVLVAGGSIFLGPAATTGAEIYDPNTGIWVEVNPMNYSQGRPKATKLSNGNILVTSGDSSQGNAEIFDSIDPSVSLEQANGQSDPTYTSPINFIATFSERIVQASFVPGDVTLEGTLNATTVDITQIAPNDGTTFNIAINGMTDSGTATISISPDVVEDLAGNSNTASTSLDNSVTFLVNVPPISNAGMDLSAITNSFVELDGSESSDPDGNLPLTYQWTQTGGPSVVLDDSSLVKPTFIAPTDCNKLTFSLVATDSLGLTSEMDEVVITVINQTNYDKGEWVITGSLNAARQWHTMTQLNDGRVLVAGGQNFSAILSSVELYDPITGLWSLADPLETGRYNHASVMLANGKVLVVGGQNDTIALASAELYDPITSTWESTGSMIIARTFPKATLLNNGKVLISGGCDGDCRYTNVISSELYDPANGTWSLTGSMNSERASHSATLLNNGKVLVTGGTKFYESYFQSINSVELYDPDSGTWSLASSMGNGRSSHTATLLPNGKVLVTGGRTIIYYHDQYNWSFTTLGSSEIYDPDLNTWEITTSMNNVRGDQTATLMPNGKVLVVGGKNYVDVFGVSFHSNSLGTAEIYDPTNETWTNIDSLNNSRTDYTATLLPSGRVLVAGGYYELAPTIYSQASAELFNITPVADAGEDQSVDTLSLVTLNGIGSSDLDDYPSLTFLWDQTGGTSVVLEDPNSANPTFTAPSDPETLIFSLIVTDNLGLPSLVDTVSITVNNQKPIANAGEDQRVSIWTLITLEGGLSIDPDGDLPLTFLWTQTGGTSVDLDDPTSPTTKFTAPSGSTNLTFSLVVTDSLGLDSNPSEVVIIVIGHNIFLPFIIN